MKRILLIVIGIVALCGCKRTSESVSVSESEINPLEDYENYCKQLNFIDLDDDVFNHVAVKWNTLLLPRCYKDTTPLMKYAVVEDFFMSQELHDFYENSAIPANFNIAKYIDVDDDMYIAGDIISMQEKEYKLQSEHGLKANPLNEVDTEAYEKIDFWDIELTSKEDGLYITSPCILDGLTIDFAYDDEPCPNMQFSLKENVDGKFVYFAPYDRENDYDSEMLGVILITYSIDDFPVTYVNIEHDALVENAESLMLNVFGENK